MNLCPIQLISTILYILCSSCYNFGDYTEQHNEEEISPLLTKSDEIYFINDYIS